VLTLFSASPVNDECGGAIDLEVGDIVTGETITASNDTLCQETCGPGVWYKVVGTGNLMTADTCGSGTDYDSQLLVLCGDCNGFGCIANNDDSCGLSSLVSWQSEIGVPYLIYVYGYGCGSGNFELQVTQDTSNPSGCVIDTFGCVIDSDGDGVTDEDDSCPGTTPPYRSVDEFGCPNDDDQDGILNEYDSCPGTPPYRSVDACGCPNDDDQDGILNEDDSCPSTPLGACVDQDGCPFDSDGDGVFDCIDNCEGTPPGEIVTSNGCSVIDEACYCFNDWKNHAAYLECVKTEAQNLLDAGLISKEQRDLAISLRRQNNCGKNPLPQCLKACLRESYANNAQYCKWAVRSGFFYSFQECQRNSEKGWTQGRYCRQICTRKR